MKTPPSLSTLLYGYFTQRLTAQMAASAHTVASYRDTFRLLLGFTQRELHKVPTTVMLEDLDAPFIGRFLAHLETARRNTPRSRNVRLAAIHSFFKYVALQEPSFGALAQRVLAIPCKRHKPKPIDFLTRAELDLLLAAPDQATWMGRRDRTVMLVAAQTGLRASELLGLRCQDVVLGTGAHVRCTGKGRKERCTPLRQDVVAALRAWIKERNAQPSDPLFPNARGQRLSHDGLDYILAKHVATAKKLVFGQVGIDMIAGPSEILVINDGSGNPAHIAADLLSQAEHDELASSILITTDRSFAEKVAIEVEQQLSKLSREKIARASWDKYGAIIVADTLEEVIEFSNRIAPEHLELSVADPFAILAQITNAGAIFMGHWTPEAAGDYLAGPNHTLPTGGTSRFFSPLSVDDFVKKSSIVYFSQSGLQRLGNDIVRIAQLEGLEAHGRSVSVRLEQDKS